MPYHPHAVISKPLSSWCPLEFWSMNVTEKLPYTTYLHDPYVTILHLGLLGEITYRCVNIRVFVISTTAPYWPTT